MTKEDRDFIAKFIITYSYASYTGKIINLFQKHTEISKKHPRLNYTDLRNKMTMMYANELFLYIVEAWKKEKEYIIKYYNDCSRSSSDIELFKKIMSKYYD